MATNYDIAFLRVAMRTSTMLERATALRCLQVIDEQGQQGRTVSAMEVAVRMGYLGEDEARAFDAQTRQELEQAGTPVAENYQGNSGVGSTEVISGTFRSKGRLPDMIAVSSGQGVPLPGPPPPLPQGPDGETYYDLSINGEGLDDHELGSKLGRGPVGACYVGRRKSDGQRTAVKVITRRFQQHPELLEQILGDVRAWQALSSPHLAEVLTIGRSNGRDVVVYQHAPGRTIAEVIHEQGPLPPSKALRVIYEIGLVLAEAQSKGIHHGDVRAEKVCFDGKHGALIDPGLARASALAQGFGQLGLAFGHPAYLAPEVLQEALTSPTPQSDVYALGILFYQMICGRLPFEGDARSQLDNHFESRLPPPPEGITFSSTVAALILKMTAKTPSQRITGAGQLVEAINRLLQGKPLFPPPARPVEKGLTKDDWGRITQEEDVVSHSREWSASAIEKAPAVGPSGLGDLDAYATGDTQRMAALPSEVEEAPGLELGEKLGRGSVGTAYEGKLGIKPVVIKVVSRKYQKYPDLQRRIMKSVGAAAELDHPNIVRALKAVRGGGGRELVVYERVHGQTLRQLLDAKGTMQVSRATKVVSAVAHALAIAGRRGLSHGDIRPEKVFYDDSGQTKLADFGLAEAACLGGGYGRYGMHFGHPAYLAPEVLQEGLPAPTPSTDIYALGVLYYELVCGAPPFGVKGNRETLKAHLTQAVPPPPDDVTIPGAVAEVILRMIAKDPARRMQAPKEVYTALEPLQGMDVSQELPALEFSDEGPSINVEELNLDSLEDLDEPTDENAMSMEEWDFQSENLAKPSGEWQKAKIEQAPRIGPEEWNPGSQEYTADEEQQDGTLSQAIQEATRKKAMDALQQKRGGKGIAPPGSSSGGGSKAPVLIGLFGLAALAGGVALFMTGQGPKPGTSTTASSSGTSTGEKPPPPPPPPPPPTGTTGGPKPKDYSKELREYKDGVISDLNQGSFQQALDRERALAEAAKGSPAGKTAIQEMRQKVLAEFEKKLRSTRHRITKLLEDKKYDEADREVDLMTWVLRDREDVKQELRGLVNNAREARFFKIKAIKSKTKIKDPRRARPVVEKKLKGEGKVVLFKNGGCFVTFPRGDELLGDLLRLKGKNLVKKDRAPIQGNPPAIKVMARKEPVLLLLNLPLKQIAEASLGLVLETPPGDAGRVALLVGVEARRLKGIGSAWGSFPVELERSGTLRSILTAPMPALELRKPIRLGLSLSNPGRSKSFVTTLQQGDAPPRTGKGGSLKDVGNIAIYVENAEVYITSLEVGGVLDPGYLK